MRQIPLLILFCTAGLQIAYSDDVYFRDHVAPILQTRCLSCHNNSDRKGSFSVQGRESAFEDGHIIRGNAAASYLIELITPVDGSATMPSGAAHLSGAEITAITNWIDDGAIWPDGFELVMPAVADFEWWSWQPVIRPLQPGCADDPWVRTPVDAFILEALRQNGLAPSEPADRRTLIRRLTFDLHGLPPQPDEVQSFVKDSDPQAYERLVDRLLASPHYGEHWARHWLDIVKYADTCGYDKDKMREHAWPYRDYVIRSFNEDKSWQRFVQEQIAGDVLFPGQADGVEGLGFIAAGPWDFIGHVEVPETKIDGRVARNLDRDEMVANTLNTFCSVTVQCARCHNHKFDPVTQENYYGLQAVFAAVDRADRRYDSDPLVAANRQQLSRRLAELKSNLAVLDAGISAAGGTSVQELNQLIGDLQAGRVVNKDPQFGYHSDIAVSAETQKWVSLDLKRSVEAAKIILRPCHDEYAGIGAGFGFPQRFLVDVSVDGQTWNSLVDHTAEDFPNPGLKALVIDDTGSTPFRYVRVTATRLAERSSDFIFALAEVQVLDQSNQDLAIDAQVMSLDSVELPVRWSRQNLVDGRWPAWQKRNANSSAQESAEVDSIDDRRQLLAAIQRRDQLLASLQTPAQSQQRTSIEQAIVEVEQAVSELPERQTIYAATTNFEAQGSFRPTDGAPRAIHILHRGDVRQPGKPARPGVLPLRRDDNWQMDPGLTEGQRRASLAQWLTSPDHPLVWRSIVNRVWQYHFGQGIVSTPNDFGRMGARPTHPELLDWLAVEFRDGNQSLKQLHRLIVTSSTYRQSSAHDVARAGIDGGNQYLWRMNRRRLTAEEIRDSILSVSGALDTTMGGPGFYLFELEKTEHSPHYEYHKFDSADPASHRRCIYRFVVRSQPDPWMTTLDCADSSQSTPKRDETLTSLQALTLLNSRFNLEMAGQFARRLQQISDDPTVQVEQAMLLLVQRLPDQSERDELVNFVRTHGLPNMCRFLFNLSEFVFID